MVFRGGTEAVSVLANKGGGEGGYRKLAADEGEGGKGIKRMAQPQIGSVKFYCDTIRILQPTPPPPPPQMLKNGRLLKYLHASTLYTPISECIFSILFSIHFLRC